MDSSKFDNLVTNFNTEMLNFADFIRQLNSKSVVAENYYLIEFVAKENPPLIIEQFILYALKYKKQIDVRDENFFLTNNYKEETHDASFVIDIIRELKDMWSTLSDKNKEGAFDVMQVLCYYAQEYFIEMDNHPRKKISSTTITKVKVKCMQLRNKIK